MKKSKKKTLRAKLSAASATLARKKLTIQLKPIQKEKVMIVQRKSKAGDKSRG
jgi:hypothetical protein